MTHITENLDHVDITGTAPGWVRRIASWFLAKKRKRASKQTVLYLLSHDDRWMEDVGLTRADLTRKLGYDPNWSRNLSRAEYFYLPHL